MGLFSAPEGIDHTSLMIRSMLMYKSDFTTGEKDVVFIHDQAITFPSLWVSDRMC